MSRERGFTLIEVLVVVGIIGTIMAIALPNFVEWSRDTSYRAASRKVLYLVRETRNLAITTNTERRVKIEPLSRLIIIENTSAFVEVGRDSFDSAIAIKSGATCGNTSDVFFHFNPNGSSTTGYICIMAADGTPRYRVGIPLSNTGRATIFRCDPTKAPECL